jgi:GTP-binding protein EngB required for normal cell division
MDARHTDPGWLGEVESLARETGAIELAREAGLVAERLREGRFYVACVGQFKRGKSTLINALVGRPVLPAGVVPVTSVITVVRWGERTAARVRFGHRAWEECDPRALETYVSEEHNPSNEKDVSGVEVFVPSSLLAGGLCLVDTPGIASVSAANTAATRAFVPHIDAALVVLGADPPISGAELELLETVAATVQDMVVVLNKADRLSEAERAEAVRFTERVLRDRLHRPVGPILQVSAAERLAGDGPQRDWPALVGRLESLARDSGADLVRAAEDREARALVAGLLAELDRQQSALTRPLAESEAALDRLRRARAAAERALEELGPRMTAVQDRVAREVVAARETFLRGALAEAERELRARLAEVPATERSLRSRAVEAAADVARQVLERWRREQGPEVDRLYRDAMQRFVALLGTVHESLAGAPGLPDLDGTPLEAALTARSGLHYTEMLRVAPVSAAVRLLDRLRPPGARRRAVERDAAAYLGRLLEVNSARIANDFQERVLQSRRALEAGVRRRLHDAVASAERAVEQGRRAQAAGAAAVQARLQAIAAVRARVEALARRRT